MRVWARQQARHVVWKLRDEGHDLQFLILDNETKFSKSFDIIFEAEGLQITHTPYRTPNANAYAEGWVHINVICVFYI